MVDLQNLNIKAKFDDNNISTKAAILTFSGAEINIKKNINIEVSGGNAILALENSVTNIQSDAKINIETSGQSGLGIASYKNATTNIQSGVNIKIQTSGNRAFGICARDSSLMNIEQNANINIITTGVSAYGIYNFNNAISNISGNVQILTSGNNSYGIVNADLSGNQTNISSTAQIYLNSGNSAGFYNYKDDGTKGVNIFNITSGAKIAIEKDGQATGYEEKEDNHDVNDSGANKEITPDNIETTLNIATTSSWKTAGDVVKEQEQEKAVQAEKEAEEQANREVYQTQYNNALSQYDSLIKDSSYKGVNLLQADDLKVVFNETRSATLDVSGVDLSSDKIGMMTADWSKAKDVQNSINQIINAKNTLRSASTKLGNYYSIITTREDFTENLINVLEEGADKLTLADMNEESANMLSLQTQQQLAINSLSLASQSSQSILRLF